MAYRDGVAVGRIMGIINGKYNEQVGEETARFFNLDCINDQEVAHRLIAQIESWARSKRIKQSDGLMDFQTKDPQGLQVERF